MAYLLILLTSFVAVAYGSIPYGHVDGDARPYHYNIYVKPYIYGANPEKIINGNVSIYFEIVNPTKEFQFHAFMRPVLGDLCKVVDGRETDCDKFVARIRNGRNVQAVVSDTVLAKGKYVVHMSYTTIIRTVGIGNYISKEKQGNVMTTQFQPEMARDLFPCVDQPDMKATYNISVSRRSDYTAISNGPLLNSEASDDGYVVDTFAQTVPMSTYLVSISVVIGYEKYETLSSSGIKVGIWSDSGVGKGVVSNATVKVLDYFEEYMQMSYSMPKYDNIGFSNYMYGAMENWGLVTWQKNSLKYSLILAAHEAAHQWMGNIVTCSDWSFVWFQEAAARYYEDMCSKDVYGMSPFTVATSNTIPSSFLPAVKEDASGKARPVVDPIKTSDDGDEIMRSHIYNKGSMIYQMIHHIMGDNKFREMWRRIMKKYKFSSISYDQFTENLQELVDDVGDRYGDKKGFQVKSFLDGWLKQPGVPIVTIERKGDKFSISQERLDQSGNPEGLLPHLWDIPLTINSPESLMNNDQKDKIVWVRQEKVNDISVDGIDARSTFVVADVASNGYFIVNYDDQNWIAIGEALANDADALPPVTKIRHWIAMSYLMEQGELGVAPIAAMASAAMNEATVPYEWSWYYHDILHQLISAFLDHNALKAYLRAHIKSKDVLCRIAESECESVYWIIDSGSARDLSGIAKSIEYKLRTEDELLYMYRKMAANVNHRSFGPALTVMSKITYSKAVIQELEGLVKSRALRPNRAEEIDVAVARIAKNIGWKERNEAKLDEWLDRQGK